MKPIVLQALVLLSVSFCANAQTPVANAIYNDITFTKTGSPYIISGDVVQFSGSTITIDPGVEVRFKKGAQLICRGNLKAIGTIKDSIRFTSDEAQPQMADYVGIKTEVNSSVPFGQSTNQIEMEFCIAEYAKLFFNTDVVYNGPYKFTNCRFAFNEKINGYVGQSSAPIFFTNCMFHDNKNCLVGADRKFYINNCWFVNNVRGTEGGQVNNCVYTNNSEYGASHYQNIDNSYFFNNKIGAIVDMHADTKFRNNQVYNNDIGVVINRMSNRSDIVFSGNKICNNATWNVRYDYTNNINLTDNCWCTTDSTVVAAKIRDGYDDVNYGLISFDFTKVCTTNNPPPATISNNIKSASVDVIVYPNPAISVITVSVPRDITNYHLVVRGIDGKVVIQKSELNGSTQVNVAALSPGIYLLNIQNNSYQSEIKKLIIR